METMKGWMLGCKNAKDQQSGGRLKKLVSLSFQPASFSSPLQFWELVGRFGPEKLGVLVDGIGRRDELLKTFMKLHLKFLGSLGDKDWKTGFLIQKQLTDYLLSAYEDNTWMLEVLLEMCLQLRVVASLFSKTGSGEEASDSLDNAMQVLMHCYLKVSKDDAGKRQGAMCMANHICKILFLKNNVARCSHYFKGIGQLGISDEDFPVSHLVTYNFYYGRVHLYEGNYPQARKALEEAFVKCSPASPKNKRLTLIFLIPVRLLGGRIPPMALLKKYNLFDEYNDLVRAVRSGNLNRFNKAMDEKSDFFIKMGVYLIIEKLRLLVLRNLIKKYYSIMKQNEKEKAHMIPLGNMTAIYRSFGHELDDEEMECMIAGLIEQRYVRGYISHAHQKLVMAKENAFPEAEK